MKKLGLFRHAKSDWGASDKRDFDRGLNERGCRGAKLMGGHIRDHGIAWNKVLASPAERVRITLAEADLGLEAEWDKQLYLASSDTMLDVLRERGGNADAVLVAGHNPGLGDMILELVAPDVARFGRLGRERQRRTLGQNQIDARPAGAGAGDNAVRVVRAAVEPGQGEQLPTSPDAPGWRRRTKG